MGRSRVCSGLRRGVGSVCDGNVMCDDMRATFVGRMSFNRRRTVPMRTVKTVVGRAGGAWGC